MISTINLAKGLHYNFLELALMQSNNLSKLYINNNNKTNIMW